MPKRAEALLDDGVGASADLVERGCVGQVLPAREPVVESGFGGHHAAGLAHRLAIGNRVQTEGRHRAGLDRECARDDPHRSGLAGAVGSQEDGDLAFGGGEIEVPDRLDLAEATGHPREGHGPL